MITFDKVNELLSYNPEMGDLRWRVPRGRGVKSGSKAGCLRKDGYIYIGIEGERHLAHRVAWLLHEGHWPDGNPEHENRVKSDNRWENIKDLAGNQSENMANQGLSSGNTSGLKGVFWFKRDDKWQAQLKLMGVKIHLGYFDDIHLAGLHYDAAAKIAWGLRFSCLNFPSEESDHIVLPDRVLRKLGKV